MSSYQDEERRLINTVRPLPGWSLPRTANIIGSHTVDKLKLNDDESLKLKARIALHGNELSDREKLYVLWAQQPPSENGNCSCGYRICFFYKQVQVRVNYMSFLQLNPIILMLFAFAHSKL